MSKGFWLSGVLAVTALALVVLFSGAWTPSTQASVVSSDCGCTTCCQDGVCCCEGDACSCDVCECQCCTTGNQLSGDTGLSPEQVTGQTIVKTAGSAQCAASGCSHCMTGK